MGVNAHMMSAKQLPNGMLLEKERTFVACRHRSERFGYIVWTSTQNWVRLYSCRLCSSICCSAMQSTSQWTCSSGTLKGLRTQ